MAADLAASLTARAPSFVFRYALSYPSFVFRFALSYPFSVPLCQMGNPDYGKRRTGWKARDERRRTGR